MPFNNEADYSFYGNILDASVFKAERFIRTSKL